MSSWFQIGAPGAHGVETEWSGRHLDSKLGSCFLVGEFELQVRVSWASNLGFLQAMLAPSCVDLGFVYNLANVDNCGPTSGQQIAKHSKK